MEHNEKNRNENVPQTPEVPAPAEQTPVTQYKKDVKFLWIYASIFCLVVVVLIAGSAVIQKKIHREVEGYQNQAQTAQKDTAQSQSRLKNVQEENKALKQENKTLKNRNEELEAQSDAQDEMLLWAQKAAENTAQLSKVQYLLSRGRTSYKDLRAEFEKIDEQYLDEQGKKTYAYIKERIGF